MTMKEMLAQVEGQIAKLKAETAEFEKLRDVIRQSSLSPKAEVNQETLPPSESTKRAISAMDRLEKAKARAAEEIGRASPKKRLN